MEKTELTPREASRKLRVSLYFVYQLLWSGKLPGKKVGKSWAIPKDAIDARLNERTKR